MVNHLDTFMYPNIHDTLMGIKCKDCPETPLNHGLHLKLTRVQNDFLESKVREGQYLSKQGAIRDILDHIIEGAHA